MFLVVSGLVIGAALGFSLQKGGFCMNTAFRSIVFERDHSLLRAWVLILVINMLALTLMEQFYLVFPQRAPFALPALIVGGLVFGVGMVVAGGCVSGTYYRMGKGMMGSIAAFLGFAGGATAVSVGALRPVLEALRRPEIFVRGESPAIYHLIPLDPFAARWIVAGGLTAAAVAWLVRAPKQRFATGWRWWQTGIVVGLISVAAWYASSQTGRDYGLSFTQPTVSVVRWAMAGESAGINWSTFMIGGVVIGAVVAALVDGEFALRLPSPRRMAAQFGGGLLMGLGAAVAGGCNIGHGVTGISAMAFSSIVATVATMAGVWAMTWIVFRVARTSTRTSTGG